MATKVVSIGDMLPKSEASAPSAAKASSIKLYREPRPDNLMPGLTKNMNEYEELSSFFAAESPSDLKWKMFAFREGVLKGTLVIGKAPDK